MVIKSKVIVISLLSLLLVSMSILTFFHINEEYTQSCDIKQEKNIYLALGEIYKIENGKYTSSDENIIKVSKNEITAVNVGKAYLDSDCYRYNIEVSDLYTKPTLYNNKDFLTCNFYSIQQNEYLDNVLKYEIESAGYKTRAGVVEAARFLTLRFKYKLNYFYENGRLIEDNQINNVDAEGRYYHKGLYLNESKFDDIYPIYNGPQIWGCKLLEEHRDEMINNGLDCSGFITWAMYNAGYYVKDIGAGIDDDRYDLTDLGQMVYLDKSNYDQLKVGDLLGFDGHIGMLIGDDGSNYYVAQMYWEGDLQVSTYSYSNLIDSEWEYAILLDEYYGEDGNLVKYWN